MAYERQSFPEWMFSKFDRSVARMPQRGPRLMTREAERAYDVPMPLRDISGMSAQEAATAVQQDVDRANAARYLENVVSRSPVLNETPRRTSTQSVLAANALAESLDPRRANIGSSVLQSAAAKLPRNQISYASPAALEAAARAVPNEDINPNDAAINEAIIAARQAAIRNAQYKKALAEQGNPAEGFDQAFNLASYGRGQEGIYPSHGATGESIQRALEMANAKANNMEFEGSLLRNYNVPQNYNVDAQSISNLPSIVAAPSAIVDRSGEDVDELRLAKDITGSTPGGALVKQPIVTPPDQSASPATGGTTSATTSTPPSGQPPMMNFINGQPNITGYRGAAYTPGAEWGRTMRTNMPGLFAETPTARTAVETARVQQATPTPMARPTSSPSPKDSILSRIFSGGDYQSSGASRGDNRLYQGEKDGRKVINWGDPESAADFFRASKAQQDWNAQSPDSPSIGAGMKRGGAAGKPDSMHKALEIIHHLLTRSH
jgi:hypothetical protein